MTCPSRRRKQDDRQPFPLLKRSLPVNRTALLLARSGLYMVWNLRTRADQPKLFPGRALRICHHRRDPRDGVLPGSENSLGLDGSFFVRFNVVDLWLIAAKP